MTLREKLQQIEVTVKGCDDGNPCIISNKMFDNSAKQVEQIADDFAIGFAEWLNNGRFSQYGNSWIDPRKNKDKDGDWLFFSSKQLLEIYKKESGL